MERHFWTLRVHHTHSTFLFFFNIFCGQLPNSSLVYLIIMKKTLRKDEKAHWDHCEIFGFQKHFGCFIMLFFFGQIPNCPSTDLIITKKPLWKLKKFPSMPFFFASCDMLVVSLCNWNKKNTYLFVINFEMTNGPYKKNFNNPNNRC
jgi:hypothetical protein